VPRLRGKPAGQVGQPRKKREKAKRSQASKVRSWRGLRIITSNHFTAGHSHRLTPGGKADFEIASCLLRKAYPRRDMNGLLQRAQKTQRVSA
jgi:hypothetical protein